MNTFSKGPALLLLVFATVLANKASAQVQCSIVSSVVGPIKTGAKLPARLSVDIDPGWHISSLITPKAGPIGTKIDIANDLPFKLAGQITAPEPRRVHSKTFDVEVETYEGEVEFILPLQAVADIPVGTKLIVDVTYQACSEETCNLPRTARVEAVVGPPPAVK